MKKETKSKTNNIERKLSEEELNNVSGGSGGCDSKERYSNDHFTAERYVTFVAQVGDEIDIKYNGNRTKAVVLQIKVANNELSNNQSNDIVYFDKYRVHNLDGTGNDGWISRNSIYKK